MEYSRLMKSSRVLGLAAAGWLAGCSGMSEQACVSSDWRGIGFEDGVRGRSVGQIGNYRQACSKYGIAPDLDAYRTGHDEGVEVYCRPSNGFDAGRRGASYEGVCPSGVEADFLSAYNTGRRLYELESAVRNIDSRIASNQRAQENIKRELTEIAAKIALDETTIDERIRLVAAAAELGSDFSELEADTKALQEDRVVAALELEKFQHSPGYEDWTNARADAR